MATEDTIASGDPNQGYYRVARALLDRLRDETTGGTSHGDAEALSEILEAAAQEFEIERHRESREELGCEHSCSDHQGLMNPRPCSTLPRELLEEVFVRLPVHELSRLQIICKNWRQILSSAQFHRQFSKHKLVCLISRGHRNSFLVRVLDRLQKWHTHKIAVTHPDVDWAQPRVIVSVECEDGGLVCFFTRQYAPHKLFLTVMNPLTGASRHLPPLIFGRDVMISTPLRRMQVDRNTNAFKVFVFSTDQRRSRFCVLYDSLTGIWMGVFGCDVRPDGSHIVPREGKLVEYNFATGRVFEIDEGIHIRPNRRGLPGYDQNLYDRTGQTYDRERLFVLQLGVDGPADGKTTNQSPMYYIDEFWWLRGAYVKANTHRCDPFERPPKTKWFRMTMHACHGHLMVIAKLAPDIHGKANERFGHYCAWLYELSTHKWSTLELPELPLRHWDNHHWRRNKDTKDEVRHDVDLMFDHPQLGNL